MQPDFLSAERVEEIVGHLRRLDAWKPLHVGDVGASGGLSRRWDVFGDELRAVGFDSLVSEIERLRSVERRPHVHYENALVGWREAPDRPAGIQPYARSTANQISASYIQTHFNAGAAVQYTNRFITLDDYYRDRQPPHVLKIDTDGSDYDVLRGAEHTLRSTLAVEIEAQFHGSLHPEANVFSAIDRFLRAGGFQLFDLQVFRYSRAALPAPFVVELPAATVWGQVGYADALYMRDLSAPEYEALFSFDPTVSQLLTLCGLFAVYGLPDCAAELLTAHASLRDLPGRGLLLDLLTPMGSYVEYLETFKRDPEAWYPSRWQPAMRPKDPAARVLALDARNRVLAERVRELKEKLRAVRLRLKERSHSGFRQS